MTTEPRIETLDQAVKELTKHEDIIDMDAWAGFDWWFDGKYWREQDNRTREQKRQADERLTKLERGEITP